MRRAQPARIYTALVLLSALRIIACPTLASEQSPSALPEAVVNEGHSGSIVRIEWSNDAETLLTSDDVNSVRLWNARSGRLIHPLTGRSDGQEYTTLTLVGDIAGQSGSIVAGNRFGLIQWRSAKAGGQGKAIQFDQPIDQLNASETGAVLIVGHDSAEDHGNRVWLRSRRSATLLELDSSGFRRIAASGVTREGDLAAVVGTCSERASPPCGLLRVWSADDQKLLRDISIDPKIAEDVRGLTFSSTGQLAFVWTRTDVVEANLDRATVRTVFSGVHEIIAVSEDRQKIAFVHSDTDRGNRLVGVRLIRLSRDVLVEAPPAIVRPEEDGHDAKPWDPATAAFSPDGKSLAVGYTDGSVALFDTTKGGLKKIVASSSTSFEGKLVLSRDGAFAAIWTDDLRIVDLVEGRRDKRIPMPRYEGLSGQYDVGILGEEWRFERSLAISPDGTLVAAKVAWSGQYQIIDTAHGGIVTSIAHRTDDALGAYFSLDGRRLYLRHAEDMDQDYVEWFDPLTGRSLGETKGRLTQILDIIPLALGGFVASQYSGDVTIFDAKGRSMKTFTPEFKDDFVEDLDTGGESDLLAISYRSASGDRIVIRHAGTVASIAIGYARTLRVSADVNRIYVGAVDRIQILSSKRRGLIGSIPVAGPVNDIGLSARDRRLTAEAGKALVVFDLAFDPPQEIFRVVQAGTDRFYTFDSTGRFDLDATDPDEVSAISWLMPDDPLRPLAPELFMRDYFEPRLASRLLACRRREAAGAISACDDAFTPVRALASLNRVRPTVRILKVERGATADEALVDVVVEAIEDMTQPNNKYRSDAYDLRLFRDGQLVGQSPAGVAGGGPIEAWRTAAHIAPGADGKTAVRRFAVRLPVADKARPVTFSAYAFNEDRVKSETTPPIAYPVPTDAPSRRRRAYVVSIGINGYDAQKWRLSYAASDAKSMGDALAGLKDYEVVRFDLISPGKGPSLATKAKIRAVLERLAGQPLAAELGAVQGANALAPARPDDLVILSFSGHGHTDSDGAFYLLPADAGGDLDRDRASFISSEELSQWLRPVDAGQMVLIIDACHSAASVAQPGFKPGPMGDRGLGQLAYDKAMRILAATQVKDVAIESGTLRQGLLTYALVRDGLGKGRPADLDTDGAITLAEWLRYAETRVPAVYEDIKAGRLRATKDPENVPGADDETRKPQTPALFDFAREQAAIVIAGGS